MDLFYRGNANFSSSLNPLVISVDKFLLYYISVFWSYLIEKKLNCKDVKVNITVC